MAGRLAPRWPVPRYRCRVALINLTFSLCYCCECFLFVVFYDSHDWGGALKSIFSSLGSSFGRSGKGKLSRPVNGHFSSRGHHLSNFNFLLLSVKKENANELIASLNIEPMITLSSKCRPESVSLVVPDLVAGHFGFTTKRFSFERGLLSVASIRQSNLWASLNSTGRVYEVKSNGVSTGDLIDCLKRVLRMVSSSNDYETKQVIYDVIEALISFPDSVSKHNHKKAGDTLIGMYRVYVTYLIQQRDSKVVREISGLIVLLNQLLTSEFMSNSLES